MLARIGPPNHGSGFMYDTSFDRAGSEIRNTDRRALWVLRIVALAAMIAAASTADGQMPGAPVLQNAWAAPGFVGAVDIAGGSDATVYAGAASWTPASGRFQLSGGLGYQTRTGESSGAAYGARLAIPFGGAASSFGFAAFAGVGGANRTDRDTLESTGTDTTASTAQIPVGAAIGWRHALGANRGISLYATPSYVFFTGGSENGGLFRAAVGADIGITRSIGATAGVEFGGTRARELGGPSGTLYGVGVSYAFGRQ